MGMARGLSDGLLRLCNGVWKDLDGDAVDIEEVIRCKDCKHYDNSEGIYWCHLNSKFYPGGMDWHSFPEDGYCSYGERKDND